MAEAVSYAPTEELDLIRSTTRRFLEEKLPLPVVRDLMMSEAGFDRGIWGDLAAMGWTGMAIPEDFGGAGFGFVELSVVLEEMGRMVTPGPFLASAALATFAIIELGSDEQKERLLPDLASGERIMTLAAYEDPRDWGLGELGTVARRGDRSWVIEGAKRHVLDAHLADVILVVARLDGGLGLFAVPAGAERVSIEQVPVLDPTRRQATVTLDGVEVYDRDLIGGATTDLSRVMALGSAALAAEQVGGAQRVLEMAVDYARGRHQFGRPIGSFQAIKHRCAEMLMKVEHAKSTAYHAARVATDHDEFSIAAPLAASVCSEAYVWAAGENIQIHGGIGFTWEHDAHLYLKRAKSSSLLLGDPRYHRALLGRALDL